MTEDALHAALVHTTFSARYVELVRRGREGPAVRGLDMATALAALPVTFKWFRREKFWRHSTQVGEETWLFHLAEVRGRIEPGLYVTQDGGGFIGGTYAKLTRRLVRESGEPPPFEGYPKVPVSDQASLEAVVCATHDLFTEVMNAIAEHR